MVLVWGEDAPPNADDDEDAPPNSEDKEDGAPNADDDEDAPPDEDGGGDVEEEDVAPERVTPSQSKMNCAILPPRFAASPERWMFHDPTLMTDM